MDLAKLRDMPAGKRITGKTRDGVRAELAKKYNKGWSIRKLADASGRSYGFIHRVLSEADDVTLRQRGGYFPRKSK